MLFCDWTRIFFFSNGDLFLFHSLNFLFSILLYYKLSNDMTFSSSSLFDDVIEQCFDQLLDQQFDNMSLFWKMAKGAKKKKPILIENVKKVTYSNETYFSDNAIFSSHIFQRCFRMNKPLFIRKRR